MHPPKVAVLEGSEASPEEMGELAEPPDYLPGLAKDVWRKYAPYAVGERTLTEASAGGFEQFCRQWMIVQELDTTLDRLGAGTKEAEPYLRTRNKEVKTLDLMLARFRLTAFGKPAHREKPKVAVNPWAKVAK